MRQALLSGLIFLSACSTASPQSDHKPVIAFDELLKRKTPVRLEWKNPDGSAESIQFYEMEIPSTEKTNRLAVAFLQDVYPGRYTPSMLKVQPRMIVLHTMALGTLRDSLIESGFLDDEKRWETPKGGKVPVGAHFMVDHDGTIYCLAPPKGQDGRTSFSEGSSFPLKHHVTEANPWAIGIENVVPAIPNAMQLPDAQKAQVFSNLSKAQVQADAKLVRFLAHWSPGISRLFGHHQFNEPKFRTALQANKAVLPEVSDPQAITTGRFDPGAAIVAEVLKQVNERGHRLTSSP